MKLGLIAKLKNFNIPKNILKSKSQFFYFIEFKGILQYKTK